MSNTIKHVYWVIFFLAFVAGGTEYLEDIEVLPKSYIILFLAYSLPAVFASLPYSASKRTFKCLSQTMPIISLCIGMVSIALLSVMIHGTTCISAESNVLSECFIPALLVFVFSITFAAFDFLRSHFRTYCKISIVFLSLSVIIDFISPGVFSRQGAANTIWYSGIGLNRNHTAHLLVLLLSLSLSYGCIKKRDVFGFILVGVAVLLTLSRLGLIMYTILFLGYIFLERERQGFLKRVSVKVVGLLFLVCLALFVHIFLIENAEQFFDRSMLGRVMQIAELNSDFFESATRLSLMENGYQLFIDAPIFGYGMAFHKSGGFGFEGLGPHCEFLRQGLDAGIMFPTLFLCFIVFGLLRFHRIGFVGGQFFLVLILVIYPFGQTLSHGSWFYALYGMLCGSIVEQNS